MSRSHYNGRGFFAIGIHNSKTPQNIGTLWRSASLYGAAFVFTVNARYQRQSSDTARTERHIPLLHFATVDDLIEHLPHGAPLVGVELDPRAVPLSRYQHPVQGVYLLGSEDHGLPLAVLDRCHDVVQIETVEPQSMNVAVAGSLMMYSRHLQMVRPMAVLP